jgi:hypothetical protein
MLGSGGGRVGSFTAAKVPPSPSGSPCASPPGLSPRPVSTRRGVLSRLLPKSMSLLVLAVFGHRRRCSSSHRDPFFIFHLFCLIFPTHLVFISQLLVMFFSLCFPHVFVCDCLLLRSVRFRLVCSGCCVHPCCMTAIIVRTLDLFTLCYFRK